LFFATGLLAQEEFGLASHYSDLFQGKPTASGELYNKSKLTGAHKTLPFGSVVKVTRLDNNKSVQVRINDRGPFISGRVIEVSKAAADQLGLGTDGPARVKVELVKTTSTSESSSEAKTEEKPKAYSEEVTQPAATAAKPAEKPAEKPKTEATKPKDEKAAKANTDKQNEAKTTKPADEKALAVNKKPVADAKTLTEKGGKPAAKAEAPKAVLVTGDQYQTVDLFQLELKRPEKKGFGVQVAALSNQDALFKKIAELQGDWFSTILVSVQQGAKKDELVYKIILGSFATQGEADIYKNNLKKNKKMNGFVVDLSKLEQD
jgi:rare lipoprotein A